MNMRKFIRNGKRTPLARALIKIPHGRALTPVEEKAIDRLFISVLLKSK